jgi:exonuclease III
MKFGLKYILFGAFLLGVLTLSQCNQRVIDSNDDAGSSSDTTTVLVQRIGQTDRFEIATWNIENFPKAGSETINDVAQIIKDLDIDLFGVEEITSVRSFDDMLAKMPGWKGVLSNDTYSNGSYQKTGILYKSEFISVTNVQNIFEDDGYAFPRPPLEAYVTVKDLEGVKFDFNMIVLHLKAKGGDSNEARRKQACEKLSAFIENEIAAGADSDFVVLGDWNDQISDPETTNVFLSFLNKPDLFFFLTMGLKSQYSYISSTYKSLIDHILITTNARDEYGQGECRVLYLDQEYRSYVSNVSDHRPVMARFNGFRLKLHP